MEHRWSDRISSVLEVSLFHNNIPVVACKTANISAHGMFVRTGPVAYARNSVLEVEFSPDKSSAGEDDAGRKRRAKKYRIPAYVIHQSKEGLGLMFRDDDSDAVSVMNAVMRDISGAGFTPPFSENNKPSVSAYVA
ncbi:MAG: PilZ domain-containing protein [Gammaproteobacteria bacterium]|nr:PilZ domain-containing protein [Gammaproteobacteria bacterium]